MIIDWQDNLLLTAAVIGLITSFVIVVLLVWGMRILNALAKAAGDSDDQKWLSPDEAMKLIMDAATGGNLKFFVDVYAQGRTRPGPVVTKAKAGYSIHNFGCAFDVGIFSPDGKKYYGEHAHYRRVGEIGEELGLEWDLKRA
jgi:hypothetical protein